MCSYHFVFCQADVYVTNFGSCFVGVPKIILKLQVCKIRPPLFDFHFHFSSLIQEIYTGIFALTRTSQLRTVVSPSSNRIMLKAFQYNENDSRYYFSWN